MTEQRDDFDTKGNADNDGGTSGDYIGGRSGMNSELGAGVSRDMGQELGSKMSRDEGDDMGAGRDATGKRYMGGEGESRRKKRDPATNGQSLKPLPGDPTARPPSQAARPPGAVRT